LTAQAQCERMALAQLEFRSELDLSLFEWFDRAGAIPPRGRSFSGFSVRGEWVLFADAGRGWLVGPRDAQGLTYPSGSVPPLHSYRADVGGGLDFSVLGVFAAKSVSNSSEPLNFFVRVRHRF
jgi:hypothetical protein